MLGGIVALVVFFTVLGVRLWRVAHPPGEAPGQLAALATQHASAPGPGANTLTPSSPALLKDKWGIEVVGLYPAVGGRVLDLRYKILDTAKVALLPNEPGHMVLIDEATGESTGLPNSPKTGSTPQNPQKLRAGRTYSLGFPNPGGRFKSGSKVTVVIGNLRAEHLAVQ